MIVFQKVHLVCVNVVIVGFYIVNMHLNTSKHEKGDPLYCLKMTLLANGAWYNNVTFFYLHLEELSLY